MRVSGVSQTPNLYQNVRAAFEYGKVAGGHGAIDVRLLPNYDEFRLLNENFQEYYLIYAYILEILKIISDGVQNKTVATLFHQTDMPKLVKKVLNYVDSHAGEVCSVKELAQKFYVNASYLSGLFSYATKINLKHYLIMRKIALAKELLMKNDSITDVAYRCSFSSSSHFISVFKKNTGQTPNKYRRSKK